MGSWSRRRIAASLGAVALVAWLAAAAWLLLGAKSSVEAGARDLRRVRRDASISSLVEPSSRADLAAAQAQFDRAHDRLHHPLLAPLRVVPIAGRHLRAADDLVATAQGGTAAADDALRALTALTKRPRAEGPQRLATLAELSRIARRARIALDHLDPGSSGSLIAPLAKGITEMDAQRVAAERAAARLEATSDAVATVLTGPDPYLLLGANNAEMRNGSGMFLSAAPLGFDQGRLDLGEVHPTAELVLAKGTVPVTGDLHANWPWLDPGRDLRNLGLTADFPQSAQLAAANWALSPDGGHVAGVLAIDVDAMRSLLRVVGPVEVGGVRYTSANVRGELLRTQYQRFAGDRTARRDQLGDVARAIFDRLEAGRWKLEDLATELTDMVQGRHLVIWSADPELQRAWRSMGADGHLSRRTLSVSLLNRSAAKLDSWIKTAVDVRAPRRTDGRRTLTLTYRITNTAPGSGPPYLVGPNVKGLAVGDHVGLVVANLPAGSTGVQIRGAREFLRGGDGPTVVVGGEVRIRRGTTVTVTVTALLPAGLEQVVLEPSARIPHTTWTVGGTSYDRDRRRTVSLD